MFCSALVKNSLSISHKSRQHVNENLLICALYMFKHSIVELLLADLGNRHAVSRSRIYIETEINFEKNN